MSRLDAALRRASTGVVAELPLHSHPLDHVVPPSQSSSEGPSDDALIPRSAPVGGGEPAPDDADVEQPEQPQPRRFGSRYADKLVVSPAIRLSLRENYRRLVATLHHAQAETGLKTLMVTSAMPEEGKTLTATNIALTLSESYHRRVLLIDGDLRRPSLADVFQVPNVVGLTEALTSVPERRVSLIQITQELSLLTAGTPDQNPMGALTSERMQRLLAEAAAGFDWVIIDTPPVGILTDAKLLAAMVDGALLVIRAGKTSASLALKAVEAVGRNRIVGVVLNRANLGSEGRAHSYYSSYYDPVSKAEEAT